MRVDALNKPYLSINFWLNVNGILPTTDAAVLKANNVQSILGIPSIDTGILGAVIVGILMFCLHEHLPDALAFFGGTRFVTDYYHAGDRRAGAGCSIDLTFFSHAVLLDWAG